MDTRTFCRICEQAYRESSWSAAGVEVLATGFSIGGQAQAAIAFRGSASTLDWINDGRAFPVEDPELGYCHAGFLSGVRRLMAETDIVGHIVSLRAAGTPVWLTGHSKGAAEATLLAGFLTAWGNPPAGLVTFGSPRAGSARLAKLLDPVPTWRYVSRGDPVPKVPWLGGIYRHVGDAILIGERFDLDPDHPMGSGYTPAIERICGTGIPAP